MLTRTSEIALQVLLCLSVGGSSTPVSPRRLAEELHASPSYVAKVVARLTQAGYLQVTRGARGGVRLAAIPEHITLLEVVELFQGKIRPGYCPTRLPLSRTCAYHRAMAKLHEAMVSVLRGWTVAALAREVSANPRYAPECRMRCVREFSRKGDASATAGTGAGRRGIAHDRG
jgi:Rrf2 family protein